jgi:hypothetical protein
VIGAAHGDDPFSRLCRRISTVSNQFLRHANVKNRFQEGDGL